MPNFDFLNDRKEFSMFSASATEAEKVFASSPAMCVIGCRKALELAVKWVYAVDKSIQAPYKDTLSALIHEQKTASRTSVRGNQMDHQVRQHGRSYQQGRSFRVCRAGLEKPF